jgi:BatD DUF11 like domain
MMPRKIGEDLLVAFWGLSVLAPAPALADNSQGQLLVTISPNPVSEHESLQLRIQADSPLNMPVFEPTFDAPDFTTVGKGMSTEIVSVNGESRKTVSFTYVLMPKRAGEFKIRAIELRMSGRPVRGPEQTVTVTADEGGSGGAQTRGRGQAGPGGVIGEDEEDASNPASPNYNGTPLPRAATAPPTGGPATHPGRFNSDFTVWASVKKTRAYVGEPIVVDYYLYDFGGLRQTEVQQWPTFTGFWKDDLHLATEVAFDEVYLQNQPMRRAFLARYAIYGIKPGHFQVDKLGIRGKYVANDINNNPFFGLSLRTGQHFSQDLAVDVLPLPEKGKPANFTGAVGKFQIKLEADKQKVPQNTPVTFNLTISGTGNFQAIDSIKLPLPPDFEIYESTSNARGSNPVGVKRELESQKTFQVVAIPRKAGKFDIPAFTWNFFNPEKETYETLSTGALQIEVSENAAGTAGTNTYLKTNSATAPAAQPPAAQELRFLKPNSLSPSSPLAANLKWPLWAFLALNLGLLLRLALSRTNSLSNLVKGVDPFAPARFALLRSKGKDVEWQAELEEVVLMCVQVLLETNPRGITRPEMEEAWKARALPLPLFQRVTQLLDEIDHHRFSSQKLPGAGSRDLRIRITREAEGIIAEATKARRKIGG